MRENLRIITNNKYFQKIALGLSSFGFFYFCYSDNKNDDQLKYLNYHLPILTGANIFMPEISENFTKPGADYLASKFLSPDKTEVLVKLVDDFVSNCALYGQIVYADAILTSEDQSLLAKIRNNLVAKVMVPKCTEAIANVDIPNIALPALVRIAKDLTGSYASNITEMIGKNQVSDIANEITVGLVAAGVKNFFSNNEQLSKAGLKNHFSYVVNNLLYYSQLFGDCSKDHFKTIAETTVIETLQPYLDDGIFNAIRDDFQFTLPAIEA